jgi:predicted nucleotidyltransferase
MSISDMDRQLLSALKREIVTRVPDAEVLLYGSAARGERTPESDYDILVLTPGAVSKAQQDEIRDAIYDIELAHAVVVALSFCTLDEWRSPLSQVSPYHRNVEKEGIAL